MNKTIRLIVLALVTICALSVNAQTVTVSNMSEIKPGARINYSIDFSNSTIMGMTETDFSKYEKDWEEDKPSIVGKFLKGTNSKLDEVLRIGSYKDSLYELKVTVTNITEMGNVFCDAVLVDKQGIVLFQVKNVNGGKEPPFLPGTKLAKIKVWANLTGKNLGSILRKEYLGN